MTAQILNMWNVINMAARKNYGMSDENYGMSDDQMANEHTAQIELHKALAAMSKAIETVNSHSCLVSIDTDAWAAFVHDEIPGLTGWDEKISEARAR